MSRYPLRTNAFQPRRIFLQRGSLLVASTVAAPVVEPLLPDFSSRSVLGAGDLDIIAARRLVAALRPGMFAANAGFWAGVAMLLGAIASVIQILEYFRVPRPQFTSRVDYGSAGNSSSAFQRMEQEQRLSGCQLYSGVSRSPLDHNVAILASQGNGSATMAMRYGDRPLVALRDMEPRVIQACLSFAVREYGLSEAKLSSNATIVGKSNCIFDGNPVQKFITADGGFILHAQEVNPRFGYGGATIFIPGVNQPEDLPSLSLKA